LANATISSNKSFICMCESPVLGNDTLQEIGETSTAPPIHRIWGKISRPEAIRRLVEALKVRK
jgi:hypothetical protein